LVAALVGSFVTGLSVLAVDQELPALRALEGLLRRSALVHEVVPVRSATEALRHLRERRFEAVLTDIAMPGLDGLELASILSRFSDPPAVVFITARTDQALAAFDVGAVGYLLKPVDHLRLAQVLRRVRAAGESAPAGPWPEGDLDPVPVEAPGRTLLVSRDEVEWVESAGDYVRLHTADGRGHLVRLSMARLEHAWGGDGFTRIHRQYLVSLRAVRELRTTGSQVYVRVGSRELPVSRRHLRELRVRLVRTGRVAR
jgi:two-component system, LytTR family, response regulator